MGLPHLQITRMYKQSLINSDLNVFNLPYFSIIETSSLNGVTDSAAAITAILSGEKLITIELIRALLEQLYHLLPTNLKKEATRSELYQLTLVDATPAGAYAFVDERTSRNEIVKYLLESNFDLFIGGGKAYFNQQEAEKHGYIYSDTLKKAHIQKKN